MCQLIHEYELHFLVGEKAGAQVAEKPIPISQGGDLEDVIRQSCRRFETFVFFSVKINISTTGAFKVGFLST